MNFTKEKVSFMAVSDYEIRNSVFLSCNEISILNAPKTLFPAYFFPRISWCFGDRSDVSQFLSPAHQFGDIDFQLLGDVQNLAIYGCNPVSQSGNSKWTFSRPVANLTDEQMSLSRFYDRVSAWHWELSFN